MTSKNCGDSDVGFSCYSCCGLWQTEGLDSLEVLRLLLGQLQEIKARRADVSVDVMCQIVSIDALRGPQSSITVRMSGPPLEPLLTTMVAYLPISTSLMTIERGTISGGGSIPRRSISF